MESVMMAEPTAGHLGCMKGAPAEPTHSGASSGTAACSQHAPAAPSAPATAPAAAPPRAYAREWLYRLVMFPSYFTPCHKCCVGNKTPKREQLLTLFDTQAPGNIYCSHCPEFKLRGHWLLQVRRSAFKDVVKASDIVRFGCDITGIQQYTLNGSKVLYLNREAAPDRKAQPTAAAPAMCVIDGRGMMDKSSQYCSLKCKMHGEDPDFTVWLDAQDPSVKEAAYAAATAPPRPTVACKRAAPNGYPYSYGSGASSSGATTGGSGGSSPASSGGSGAAGGAAGGGVSSARSRKAPRNAASEAAGPGGSTAARPAAAPRPVVVRLPSAVAAAKAAAAAASAAAAAFPTANARQAQQSAFLAAATDGPVLGGGAAAAPPGGGCCPGHDDWLDAAAGALGGPLDAAGPCSPEWGAMLGDDLSGHGPADHGPAAAADWWMASAGDLTGPAAAGPAPPAPLHVGLHEQHAGGAGDDPHGLLVEWPAGGAPCLGPAGGGAELLPFGSMASSPGSDCAIEGAFLWA